MAMLPGSSGTIHMKASGWCTAPYRYKAIKVIGKTTVIIGENELKIQRTRFRLSKRKNFLRVNFFFLDNSENILEAIITLK